MNVDVLMTAFARMAGIDGEKLKKDIATAGQIAVNLKEQLDRIEDGQRLIIAHLGLTLEGSENADRVKSLGYSAGDATTINGSGTAGGGLARPEEPRGPSRKGTDGGE